MPSGVKDIQLLELKDTISQLNKTISTQNELISSLQKMLEERNAKDSEKDLLIANLQSQLAYLKNKVFGSTSEIRHDQLDGQLNLFGTPVGDEKPAEVIEPEVISVKGYTKERKPKATYDDKYNSVRSICKHFFTDIVGLSIKFFCVSLRHMSMYRRIVPVGIIYLELYELRFRMSRQYLIQLFRCGVEGEPGMLYQAFFLFFLYPVPHLKIVEIMAPAFPQVMKQIEIEISDPRPFQ